MTARHRRRLGAALATCAIAAGVAIVGTGGPVSAAPSDEKAKVDRQLERAKDRLSAARGRERVLTDEVSELSSRVRVLEQRLAPLRQRAAELQAEVDRLEERLDALTTRLGQEQRRLRAAQRELAERREVLSERLLHLYVRGVPDPVTVLLESDSLSQAVEMNDALEGIVRRDHEMAAAVREHVQNVTATRDRIAEVRREVAEQEERAERAAQKAMEAKAELETQQASLRSVRDERSTVLSRVRGDRATIEVEARNLEQKSAALQAKIQRAQAAAAAAAATANSTSGSSSSSSGGGAAPAQATQSSSSSGFIWPASGTLTSSFGWRWGRMHEGIDIGAPTGAPIVAVSAGTVIVAGWQGGYGQMVVVDHGNGVSTAYAHQSRIGVSVGQSVGQGTVLGAVGSTGNSTGPHLHFEVRINGGAVNPMGYL